jgi:tol-pal system protein YbgF
MNATGIGFVMKRYVGAALVGLAAAACAGGAWAQNGGNGSAGWATQSQRGPAQVAQKPARKAPASKPQTADSGDADASVRQRVEQLEEQIVDLQVAIGTMESFAKGGARAQSMSGGGGGGTSAAPVVDLGSRMEAMETRVSALSRQIEQLSRQLRSLEARDGLSMPPAAAGPSPSYYDQSAPPVAAQAYGRGGDQIGGLIRGSVPSAPLPPLDGAQPVAAAPSPPRPAATSSAAPPVQAAPPSAQPAAYAGGNAKEIYDKAYGYLLRQEYGGAEQAFAGFLRQFPQHERAGHAQYWLGETYFVRGQYKEAASAFLAGYQTYAASEKAPDSLLKLGMSLGRLGQKQPACSALAELTVRFPNAPAHIVARAKSERARSGC